MVKPDTIKKLALILTPKDKLRLGLLFLAILMMAVLQVVGIASILPFMQLVAEPETIISSQKLQWLYNYFGFTSERALLIATGTLVFVLITAGNIFSAFTVWMQHKYVWEIAHNVSTRLLFNYLTMPYDFFIRNNVSDLDSIHDFIVNELPDGYKNNIGDRGVRLSDGQKQRVGLARAFYRRPGLIILDEATNALDSIAENSVMEALNNAKGDITVINIAHRISSVKNADCINSLEKEKIKAKGHYEMLIDTNDTFREMAQHS